MNMTITLGHISTMKPITPHNSESVHLSHGGNDIAMNVAGFAVGRVRRAVAQTLNVPDHAAAFVNGKAVANDHVLSPGDGVEFLVESGNKGLGEIWEKAEFMKLLHMTEADWQDWVDKGLPFDTMRDGTIVLNETQVDEWKSKSHIKLLEPAPVIQTTATPPLLSVNLKDGTATLNGEIYNLESVHLLLLQALLQMPGNWITYSEMKVRVPQLTSELDRLDKAMKRMPKPFLRLIKRQRGRGCRLLTTNT